MRWGHEIVKACLAGTVMHFVIVTACSGWVHTPDKASHTGGSGPTASTGGASAEPIAAGRANTLPSAGAPGTTDADDPALMMPVEEAEAAESGSRLKARWYVGDDGARQPLFQWFDSARNEECTFQRATDGVLRCMPGGAGLSSYYSNANCTQRAAVLLATLDCGDGYGTYAIESATTGCESRIKVFTLGETLPPESVYVLSGESCVAAAPNAAFVYRRLGSEVAPSSFVSAQLTTDG